MEKIHFQVQGSALLPYEVTFIRIGSDLAATCTCPAGLVGTSCKHRLAIFNGSELGIVSSNAIEVATVVSWLPGSAIASRIDDVSNAQRKFDQAKKHVVDAKNKLAAAMRPTNGMTISSQEEAGRVPFTWISFCDSRNGIAQFASEWFFWVHSSFKPALDIRYTEAINKKKTVELRDKKSLNLFGVTHQELKDKISNSNIKLADSIDHQKVMAYSEKFNIETQGSPLLFSFRATDSLESRCANWYVQITQATPATSNNPGEVGFQLFRRNTENPNLMWELDSWLSTTQADFVDLLRNGICSVIDLTPKESCLIGTSKRSVSK